MWAGTGHPKCSDELLKDLAEELISLQTRTIQVGRSNLSKPFRLRAFICDAPARAFVKNVLNHNSKHGCNECDQIGFRLERTPVYQIQSGNLRTDESFKNRLDMCHHHNESQTILERAKVNMVNQFPLDPMHLIDLGIAKKILTYILEVIPKNIHHDISKLFISLGPYLPCEFTRKPRGISEIARWKAIEFRMFILYSGIVVLRDYIPDSNYYHLVLLTTALRLMSDPINCKYNVDSAQLLIDQFIEIFSQLYGLKHVNYNIHSLLHLPNYVRLYG